MVVLCFFTGKGIGPLTFAPVRFTVSTISFADLSMSLWSKAFNLILMLWFCTTPFPLHSRRVKILPKKSTERWFSPVDRSLRRELKKKNLTYWFDTTNAQASIALAAAEGTAITASSGILYDPSGPKSKYISGTETVSSGSAKIVVFKPTGWNANDVCAIEIVGDTNSGANIHSADRLTIKALNASYASSSLNSIGDFDLSGTETVAEFTNITGTINHNIQAQHATANAAGFMVMWERKDTGLEPADIKKGWYVRWNTTAL